MILSLLYNIVDRELIDTLWNVNFPADGHTAGISGN